MSSVRIVCFLAPPAAALVWLATSSVFLTDDAFISFRYAANFSAGDGLVFNPGAEPVEGYTNFLWVLLLAGFDAVGLSPETVAFPLSLLCTLGLWALVAAFGAWMQAPSRWLGIVLAPLLLVATRSWIVWASGGLETRLFELLVFAGVFALCMEREKLADAESTPRPIAGLCFGLAALTRPEGVLLGALGFGAIALFLRDRWGKGVPWLVRSGAVFGGLVGAHFAFRRAYYGEWLPNTYYAKVGSLGWETGAKYLAAFALEYAVYLWIPFLVCGTVWFCRMGRAFVPALFGAVCVPHALYVASVGGDHFEYRPLDLYFPFAYLLLAAGAASLARSTASAVAVGVACLGIVVGIVELPRQAASQFPAEYLAGFPGAAGKDARRDAYLDPGQSLVYRLPLLRSIAETHRDLLRDLSSQFVGLRREEHALFLEKAVTEGKRLRALVESGRFPEDASIAICCVGAIPYYSGLRTLDKHGLTDEFVARLGDTHEGMMAHSKSAPFAYGKRQGIDLWSVHSVHILFEGTDPDFLQWVAGAHRRGLDAYFADLGDDLYLLIRPPQGLQHLRARFPKIKFESTRNRARVAQLARSLGAVVE